jgi:putative Mg2+ transporter-C (MgtC) family protein
MEHGVKICFDVGRRRDPAPPLTSVLLFFWPVHTGLRESARMLEDLGAILVHLLSAAFAGGCIGLERSFHGRPAGFRTHTLVCLASSLLMLVTLYQWKWLPGVPLETVRTDPTRMAQGIMTGIGFLGAGVIFKEGLSVRGLTTAASIWTTAAIGILAGVGFYLAAALATLLVLGTLSAFRWIEQALPSQIYAHHHVKFARDNTMREGDLRGLISSHSFSIANMSYRVSGDGLFFEYRMIIRTNNWDNMRHLAETLRGLAAIVEFRISPTGD